MMWILILALVVVAGFLAWKAWDPATKTFSWQHGLGAIAVLAAAVWAYLGDFAHSLFQ